jgi:hypothetical protein
MCKMRFHPQSPCNNEYGIQRYGPSDAEWEECPGVSERDFGGSGGGRGGFGMYERD